MATLSAKEAARELGTDARTLRKFMRAVTPKEEQPGQGNRYHIEEETIPSLKEQFAAWSKPKTRATEPEAEAVEGDEITLDADMIDEEDDPDEGLSVSIDGPTDDEIEALDDDDTVEEEFDLEEL
jgi:hypothetical protein